jgi:hypothetical protein
MTPTVENLGARIGVLPAYDHYGSNRPRCVQSKDTRTRDLPVSPVQSSPLMETTSPGDGPKRRTHAPPS